MVRKAFVLGYGAVAYLAFVAALLYTIGFLAGVGVPKDVDDGAAGPAGRALVVDAALLTFFAAQHSVMARPWFKRWWTRFVPPAIRERPEPLQTETGSKPAHSSARHRGAPASLRADCWLALAARRAGSRAARPRRAAARAARRAPLLGPGLASVRLRPVRRASAPACTPNRSRP